ncbi:MAG TPA: glycosyltransferase family 4 protein [Candidatus Nitrosopolaris sp.]|nr:glycosyltransferase family 4 protein [Candidatus Nitrosopolaris sp.]
MDDKPIRVLMVTTEYPPMQGGVGRYTENLTRALQKLGLDVYIVCNEKGKGDYYGLSPYNEHNSDVILKAVHDSKADIVHIQYEQGLYGLVLDPINPEKATTNIDTFYHDCKVPIVTTFHSAYTFKQWMNLATITENTSKVGRYAHFMVNSWKHLLNYHSFHNINKKKLAMSEAGIVFSHYLSKLICCDNSSRSCNVIYHGAEPSPKLLCQPTKKEARSRFSLPQDRRIALALGFTTATKGWKLLEKMDVPDNWIIVVNSSKNHYNKEKVNLRFNKSINNSVIDLRKDFLDEEDLSFLFYAVDATILPYTVTSSSGVMIDGLAHGLPFVASDLGFFREFSSKGLGITVKRKPDAFANGLRTLAKDYDTYVREVNKFKEKLKWDLIATQHSALYENVLNAKKAIVIRTLNSKVTVEADHTNNQKRI